MQRKAPSRAVSTVWVVLCLFWLDMAVDKLRNPQDHVHSSRPHTYLQLVLWGPVLLFWSIAAWRAWRTPQQRLENERLENAPPQPSGTITTP